MSDLAPSFSPGIAHRVWRCLPPDMRRRAFTMATSRLAPRPDRMPPKGEHGLAIAGEFSQPSGLGEGARLMARAVHGLGLPVWSLDVPSPIYRKGGGRKGGDRTGVDATAMDIPPFGAPLVLHVNAPFLPLALMRLGRGLTRGRRIIGYWAWELPVVPPEWHGGRGFVHEVWVPSRFTAAALEPLMPGRVRVVPPALAMAPPNPSALDRAAFGLPDSAVIVLMSFNMASSFERKNPLAAIQAFRLAFGERSDRLLLVKVLHADHAPADFARLLQAAQAPNIRVETRAMPDRDRHALTAVSDIVLSLHRSEGFGLVPAEAMMLGRSVIATAWSGNMDYMDRDNAALVGYRLVPASDDRSVYRNASWAEPDLGDAVTHLRFLADNEAARRGLGERARLSAARSFGTEPLVAALRGVGFGA